MKNILVVMLVWFGLSLPVFASSGITPAASLMDIDFSGDTASKLWPTKAKKHVKNTKTSDETKIKKVSSGSEK